MTTYHVLLHYLSVYGSRDNTSCLGAHAHPEPERVVPEKGAYDMYKEECCSQNIALPVMCITTAHPVNELSEKFTENNLFKSRAYQVVSYEVELWIRKYIDKYYKLSDAEKIVG